MSKKDYERVAAAVKAQYTAGPLPRDRAAVAAVAESLAAALADDNPKFDRARFLRACGVEG